MKVTSALDRVAVWHTAVERQQLHRGFGVPLNQLQGKSGEEILRYLHGRGGLGRSWATSHLDAQIVAGNQSGGMGPKQRVPVTVSADWDGMGQDAGPDPDIGKKDSGGRAIRGGWPEGEVPLMRGTPLNVTNLRVQYKPAGEWQEMLTQPRPGKA